jgi:hypothetical protein
MFKLISILIALIPVFLFLRAVLGRSATVRRAAADFKRQIDFVVWALLFIIAAAMLYSLISLVHPLWR